MKANNSDRQDPKIEENDSSKSSRSTQDSRRPRSKRDAELADKRTDRQKSKRDADPADPPADPLMTQPYTGPADLQGITSRGHDSADDLRMAKEFAEMIVDTVREGLLVLDLDLRVRAGNESFYRMFDMTREDTEGRLIYELSNGTWDMPVLRDVLERVLPENKAFDDLEVEEEFEGIGRRIIVLNARQLDDHEMVLLAFEDVTERRTSEKRLLETEDRYRFFVENAQEYAIFHLDAEGRILSWNRGAGRVFGYEEADVIGRPIDILFTDEDRTAGEPLRERLAAAEKGRAADDRWHVRKNGTLFWASGAVEALRHENGSDRPVRGFTKILRDNTERKQAEEALKKLNDDLERRVQERTLEVRRLASTLTMAEQQERRRLSQILHDDLQQILYGIQMKLISIRSEHNAGESAALQKSIEKVSAWMDKAIDTTRRLTADLSPPVLTKQQLTDAFDWLRMQMQEMHGLTVEVKAPQAYSVPDENMRILLFQIVRELLFNIVKHADTDRAVVEINSVDHHLIVQVSDNGRGFDVAKAARRTESVGGFGLFSVRDRLSLFRGRLEIDSSPGAGTRVKFIMPIQEDAPDLFAE